MVGSTIVTPVVTAVEPALVTITACVDKSSADFLDGAGNSLRAANVPGAYWRHLATAEVGLFEGGLWLVALDTNDWSTTC